MPKTKARSIRSTALLLLLAGVLALAGCAGKERDPEGNAAYEVIEIIPGTTPEPASATLGPELTEEPTPAPTAVPSTDEERLLAGLLLPLNGGEPISASFGGISLDIDSDGVRERIQVSDSDGGPALCIDTEPFMDIGTRVFLASLDGKNIVFLSQRPGEDGYFAFYPDEGGNLFCRLFAIASTGDPEDLVIRSSYEDYIRGGLDIMLHNPMLYSSESGSLRTLFIDLDGDGAKDEISFDSEVLSVNGQPNAKILSTTMPRFTWDEAHGAVVISGTAGDYALRLRLENGALIEEVSYADLL